MFGQRTEETFEHKPTSVPGEKDLGHSLRTSCCKYPEYAEYPEE